MPRLTNKQYLEARAWLKQLWLDDDYRFSGLTPNEQWALHDFFDPTFERTVEDALLYRKQVSARQLSLPQRAGRALKELRFQVEHDVIRRPVPHVVTGKGRQATRAIAVSAVVRPHPDYPRLARALLELAKQMQENGDELPAWKRSRSPER